MTNRTAASSACRSRPQKMIGLTEPPYAGQIATITAPRIGADRHRHHNSFSLF
jgi:hypothetical protein